VGGAEEAGGMRPRWGERDEGIGQVRQALKSQALNARVFDRSGAHLLMSGFQSCILLMLLLLPMLLMFSC
jgi:hypothetical protein